jgi:outer membrane protein OmpA-like peptidoglycan-associated protein
MKFTRFLLVVGVFLLAVSTSFAQAGSQVPSMIVAQPDSVIFGPDQQDFNQNMKEVLFPFDNCECGVNDSALRDNVAWLKAHPNVRIYVAGYADARGGVLYNVALAQRRADAVKAALVKMGVPDDRIVVAAGWGEMFGACIEDTDACHAKNRRVRLVFATVEPALSASTN